MAWLPLRLSPDRRRSAIFLAVLLLHVLVFVLVLRPGAPLRLPPQAKVFEMVSVHDSKPAPAPAPKPRAAPAPHPKLEKATPVVAPPIDPRAIGLIELTPQDMRAGDIARMPSQAVAAAADGAGTSSDTGLADGTGPGGEKLYNAEWYREPTHTELAFYLPNGAPRGSWAVIACHTIADYRVDRCVELGVSPYAPGLGRAMIEASWQFRVRPPRIGGHAMVGEWVKIRFDFSDKPDR